MYKSEIEKTLSDGRKIICYASNGNSRSNSGAVIYLLEPNTPRAGSQLEQEKIPGVIKKTETTCYKGNVGWSIKKEAELIGEQQLNANDGKWTPARVRGSGDADIPHDSEIWIGSEGAEQAIKDFESDGSVFYFWL